MPRLHGQGTGPLQAPETTAPAAARQPGRDCCAAVETSGRSATAGRSDREQAARRPPSPEETTGRGAREPPAEARGQLPEQGTRAPEETRPGPVAGAQRPRRDGQEAAAEARNPRLAKPTQGTPGRGGRGPAAGRRRGQRSQGPAAEAGSPGSTEPRRDRPGGVVGGPAAQARRPGGGDLSAACRSKPPQRAAGAQHAERSGRVRGAGDVGWGRRGGRGGHGGRAGRRSNQNAAAGCGGRGDAGLGRTVAGASRGGSGSGLRSCRHNGAGQARGPRRAHRMAEGRPRAGRTRVRGAGLPWRQGLGRSRSSLGVGAGVEGWCRPGEGGRAGVKSPFPTRGLNLLGT